MKKAGVLKMSNITKYALESSLKKMMLTKPLDKITIRDLTEDCAWHSITILKTFMTW